MGVDALTVGPKKISISPGPRSKLDPLKAIAIVSAQSNEYQLTPDSRLIVNIPTANLRDLYFSLEKLFKKFSINR
jgi:hypothetical protein